MTCNYFALNNNEHSYLFDVGMIRFIYPNLDLSNNNIYGSICQLIEENQYQLIRFQQLQFKDNETKMTLLEGTKELLRRLQNFKSFLQKYLV